MKCKSELTVAIASAVFAVLGGTAVYAQDKYSLKSPSGIAFSDFRGYEDWAVVSSARTDEVLIRHVYGRSQPLRLRTRVPCGRESERPHLPPIPEALNRAPPTRSTRPSARPSAFFMLLRDAR